MTALLKLYLWMSLSSYSVFTNIHMMNITNEYCNICRSPLVHTLCKYTKNGCSDQCFGYDNDSTLSMEDTKEILKRLNFRRNYIALGSANNIKLPSASNMRELKWSEELAIFAQRWADQCIKRSHPDLVDQCRDTANMAVNQNIATFIGYSPGLTVKGMVDTWFMESLDYKGDVLTYKQPAPTEKQTQHFTQIIWAETYLVGCGRSRFQEKGLSNINIIQRLVCNFAPGGNLAGTPVYSPGTPISKCPPGTGAGINFSSLCRELKNYTADAYNVGTNSSYTETKINETMEHDTEINLNSKTRERVNKNEKKIRQINEEPNPENVDFHHNYGDWHVTEDDYLEHPSREDEIPVYFQSNQRDKSYQSTTDLPLEVTIHRPTHQPEIENTPYKYTLLTGRNKYEPTESARRMDLLNTDLKKCSRKGNQQQLNVEDKAEIVTHSPVTTFTSSTVPYYPQHVIHSAPKKTSHFCPCIKKIKSTFESVVTDNSWDCLHTSTDLPKYPIFWYNPKTYTVFATKRPTQEHKRNANLIPRKHIRLSPQRQNRGYCTSLRRNWQKGESQETTTSLVQKFTRRPLFVIPTDQYDDRMITKSMVILVSTPHCGTRPKGKFRNPDQRSSRCLRKSLPGLKLLDHNYKSNYISTCTKASVHVRALKSASVPKQHEHKSYKLNEKITLPIIEHEMKEPKNDSTLVKEKNLTFDEVMSLRKKQQVKSDEYSIDNGDAIIVKDGRRAGEKANVTTTNKPKSPRKCTRKHTCTWTATIQGDGAGGKGEGGGGGGGGGGRYNFVDGCTQTSTCTRENQISTSRKTTSLDLCEKRFLDHGDNERLNRCNLPKRNNRHYRTNTTRSRSLRSQTKSSKVFNYSNRIKQRQNYESRLTRSVKRITENMNSDIEDRLLSFSFKPMFSKANDFVLPNPKKIKITKERMKSRNPRNIKIFDLLPDVKLEQPISSQIIGFKKNNKRKCLPKDKKEISYDGLLKLVTKKIESLLENGQHFPCGCSPKT